MRDRDAVEESVLDLNEICDILDFLCTT